MKNLFKWIGIALAALIVFIISALILAYFFLPLDKIKDFATAKLSEQLKREVKIQAVSFNIFSGIKLKGLTISNRKPFDDRPFIAADAIELKYAFWPLLQGKVIVPEISLVRPQIIIEKSRKGDFNFSDIFAPEKPAKKAPPPPTPPKKSEAVDLIINTFSIKNGRILYIDYAAKGENELKGIHVKVSGITLALVTPIEVKASAVGTYQKKDVPVAISGNIGIDLSKGIINLPNFVVSVAGESLRLDAQVAPGPAISAKLSSDKMAIDPFLAIFAAAPPTDKKAKTEPGALTNTLKQAALALPLPLRINALLDLKNTSLGKLKLDTFKGALGLEKRIASFRIDEISAYQGKFNLKGLINLPALSYNLGQIELKHFNSAVFIDDLIDSFFPDLLDMKGKVEGNLDAKLSLKGSGVEMPQVFDNLEGSGVVLLAEGRLKKLKSLSSIGAQYNVNLLQNDMLVRGLRAELGIKDRQLEVTKLTIQDTDLQVGFAGGLDFNKMEYKKGNRLTLKFSSAATSGLPKEFTLIKDASGFTTVEFELTGKLSSPLPALRLEKPLETMVGNLKVKVEAKKVEIETKAKEEVQKAADQTKEQLKQEAEKKVKEILKF